MSGFEVLAAALGTVDVGLRSISLLYDSIKDLKSAPKEITRLRADLEGLQICLSGLDTLLQSANNATSALVRRFGLPEAAKSCSAACAALHQAIPRPSTTCARFYFFARKREIVSVMENIAKAKQTTILTAVVAGLALQTRDGGQLNPSTLRDAETEIARISVIAQEQRDQTTTQAANKAQEKVQKIKQEFHGVVNTKGDGNEVGIAGKKGDFGEVKQEWKENVTTMGDRNKVGIVFD
ncbi:hypothetical protein K491DRAFT_778558 [Lophiostoma macrostomum CBS 122681]|uniref:Fungal N-terminal domain-containing protein n=1 Tax=Lophiostoma macrostomum CBS 122681 TaxID=1314788 RepID=A0A6A6T8X3_9PLEO|nr:hypothetical protein K491DRAFT_778558 [Lophiostoma macrostomum CBS 122681]